jgi:hypothetical protein
MRLAMPWGLAVPGGKNDERQPPPWLGGGSSDPAAGAGDYGHPSGQPMHRVTHRLHPRHQK